MYPTSRQYCHSYGSVNSHMYAQCVGVRAAVSLERSYVVMKYTKFGCTYPFTPYSFVLSMEYLEYKSNNLKFIGFYHSHNMTPLFSPLFLSAALASAAIVHAEYFSPPDNYHRFATRAQGINWTECTDDSGKLVPNHECGRFEVPLDWHNETAGKASLAVVRRRAATQPRLGAIFFNPGGPGQPISVFIHLYPYPNQSFFT